MTMIKFLQVCLICASIQQVLSFATTSQECESPCETGRTCEVSCTAVSGAITFGLLFYFNGSQIVGCPNQQCSASFPAYHNYTYINSTTASLQILNFNSSLNTGLYECADGNGVKDGFQVSEVMTADIPDGNLVGSADPAVPGRVTCSVTKAGTASLTLTAPDGTVLATNASTILTADVGNVSSVTCSLEWPTCQKYTNRKFHPFTVNISCPCVCDCVCDCTAVIVLVIILAISTCALCAGASYLCCGRGCICRPDRPKGKLGVLEGIVIALIVVTIGLLIAVGIVCVGTDRSCVCKDCRENPCDTIACCSDARNASIAFLVLGSAAVVFAFVALLLSLCCGVEGDFISPTVEATAVPLHENPSSGRIHPGDEKRLQNSNSSPGSQIFNLKTFVIVNFIKERKTHLVHRKWLSLGVTESHLEMFCVNWPEKDQEHLALSGAAPSNGWKLCPVGITSSNDDFNNAMEQQRKSEEVDAQELPGIDIISFTKGADLNNGLTLKKFVLVEFIKDRKARFVHRNWLVLKKEDHGLECFHAALPPKDQVSLKEQEALAKDGTPPSKEWKYSPVMILASADDSQLVLKKLKNIQEAQKRDKRSSNGESLTEKMPSPKGQLPPVKIKGMPDSQEPRPLPIPQSQRRPSMDGPVNMSGSNISPLPMRNAFNSGQQPLEQSESGMARVESSSFKKN